MALASAVAVLPSACSSDDPPSPVGAWQMQVQTTLPSSGTAKITFHNDGTVLQEGSNTLPGTGFWQISRDNKVTFQVTIPLADSTKENIIGTIRGQQTADFKKDKVTATGTSELYDLKGNKTKSFQVTLTGAPA
ncbi:hypothetical protein AB0M46_02225 [Dactylosporangium sp. NPDC051485]|uniref:hypothetical protein n=1 Tax=Dactylosporangium sp. NPDC051485 TaxID=3154846 RepID=UPI003416CE96